MVFSVCLIKLLKSLTLSMNEITHYNDIIMSIITHVLIVCSIIFTSKIHVTGLCAGNPLVTGEFPSQRPVMWKIFPFDNVIMWYQCYKTCIIDTEFINTNFLVVAYYNKSDIEGQNTTQLPRTVYKAPPEQSRWHPTKKLHFKNVPDKSQIDWNKNSISYCVDKPRSLQAGISN